MQRFFTTVLTLVVILAGVSFVAAPYVGFFALRSAALAQDSQGLADLVDFDAVRGSLRPQLGGADPAAAPPSVWQDPLGALKHAIEPLQPAPKVDAYLTPAALAGLTLGKGRDAQKLQPVDLKDSNTFSQPWPGVEYWGVNRARLTLGTVPTVFTWERKGFFKWKLVGVKLPADAPKAAPAAAPAG